MVNIQNLLSKTEWTGAEIGKLHIAANLNAYAEAVNSGNYNTRPAVSQADIKNMLRTLTDPEEQNIYYGYISIYKWASSILQVAHAQQQQAQHNLNMLLTRIEKALTSEQVLNRYSKLPLILTEKQYNDFVEQRKEEILKEREDEETDYLSVWYLIFHAQKHFKDLLEEDPKAKNPLKPLKKKLEKLPLTSEVVAKCYNRIKKIGGYVVDGQRILTKEDKDTLLTPAIINALKDFKDHLTEENVKLIFNCFESNFDLGNISIEILSRFGLSQPLAEKIITELNKSISWEPSDEPPELTAWDFITTHEAEAYYMCWEEEDIKAFNEDFPGLAEALEKAIEEDYPELEIDKAPKKDWLITLHRLRELSEINFYNLNADTFSKWDIFDSRPEVYRNGIAILDNELHGINPIDEEPFIEKYTPPDIAKALTGSSLETYFPESPFYSFEVEDIEDNIYNFLASLYFLKAFNRTLELIAVKYDIEEILALKMQAPRIEAGAIVYNETRKRLIRAIESNDYNTPELIEKKLEVLEGLLIPINLSLAAIPKSRVAATKEIIKDFKGFDMQGSTPFNTLCQYDPDYYTTDGLEVEESDNKPIDEEGQQALRELLERIDIMFEDLEDGEGE